VSYGEGALGRLARCAAAVSVVAPAVVATAVAPVPVPVAVQAMGACLTNLANTARCNARQQGYV
jgi:hypothetical protein